MKSFTVIPTALLLICVFQSQAQTNTSTLQQQALQYAKYLTHSIEKRQTTMNNSMGNAERTTGFPERLIASSIHYAYEYNTDSSSFIYSENRSSAFDFNSMEYEVGYNINQQYQNPVDLSTTYNAVGYNGTPEVLSDSSIHYHSVDGSTFPITDQQWSSYDNANNVVLFGDHNISTTIFYKSVNTYDTNQNMISALALHWNGSAWDSIQRRRLSYDGNMIATDSFDVYQSDMSWLQAGSWSYTYNNSGKLTNIIYYSNSGSWMPQEEFSISYYPDNTLQKDSLSMNLNGAWEPFFKDSVGYTSGVNYISFERKVNYDDTGAINTYEDYSKHITNGLPDAVSHSYYVTDGVPTNTRTYFTYDNHNNPVTATQYDIDYNDLENVEIFYYQTSNTAVNNIIRQAVNIEVYPNPTTNEINISQTDIQQGAITYITLINALGQKVYTESLPWINSTETISVAGLKAGNYWLIIQSKDGTVLSRQIIVKE